MNNRTTSSTAQAMTGIRTPHNHDVLCGRGGNINAHPGNKRFRKSVERHRQVYLNSRFKEEKRLVATAIIDEIRSLSPPGRFLAKDTKTDTFYDIGDEKANDKTRQALRENAPSHRKGMKRTQEGTVEIESATKEKANNKEGRTASSNITAPSLSYPYPPQAWAPNYYPYSYQVYANPFVPPPPPHNIPNQGAAFPFPVQHSHYPPVPYNLHNGQAQQSIESGVQQQSISRTSSTEVEQQHEGVHYPHRQSEVQQQSISRTSSTDVEQQHQGVYYPHRQSGAHEQSISRTSPTEVEQQHEDAHYPHRHLTNTNPGEVPEPEESSPLSIDGYITQSSSDMSRNHVAAPQQGAASESPQHDGAHYHHRRQVTNTKPGEMLEPEDSSLSIEGYGTQPTSDTSRNQVLDPQQGAASESSRPSTDDIVDGTGTRTPDESVIQEASLIISSLKSPLQQLRDGSSDSSSQASPSAQKGPNDFQPPKQRTEVEEHQGEVVNKLGDENEDSHRDGTTTPDHDNVDGAPSVKTYGRFVPFSPIQTDATPTKNTSTPVSHHKQKESTNMSSGEHPTPQNPHTNSDEDDESKVILLEQVAEHIRTSWDCESSIADDDADSKNLLQPSPTKQKQE